MKTAKIAVSVVVVACFITLFTRQTLAYPPFVAKAKKFGAKDCTFCHVDPEGGPPWNARGQWLIKEKERRNADSVDVEWLADYKPEPDKKDDKSSKPPDKKDDKKDEKKPDTSKPPSTVSSVERQLLDLERTWLDSYVKRDIAAMSRIEADDFMIVYPDGSVLTRADELANLKKPVDGAQPSLSTEGTKVRIYGDTAVLTGVFVQQGTYQSGPKKNEQYSIKERYTDVYVKRNGNWQVVSSHLTSLQPVSAASNPLGLALDTTILDSYVGEYELPIFVLSVTREGNRLYGQPPGDTRRELIALSDAEFRVGNEGPESSSNDGTQNVDARIVFLKDAAGKVSSMKVNVGGQQFEGKKIK